MNTRDELMKCLPKMPARTGKSLPTKMMYALDNYKLPWELGDLELKSSKWVVVPSTTTDLCKKHVCVGRMVCFGQRSETARVYLNRSLKGEKKEYPMLTAILGIVGGTVSGGGRDRLRPSHGGNVRGQDVKRRRASP